jgi:hypothetical protein
VIPESGGGLFDIGRFVLKIMSVDHQARSGESGVFAEDTIVVFFEPLEEAWCYVHHLTLLDIHARGYVRPICFTYATRDNQKLMGNFKSLYKHFTEVSNVLKTGNYQLFRDDLKMRMADLAYTKGVVDTMEGASMMTAATPGIITRHFEDMQLMREKMKKQATLVLSPENSIDDVDLSSFIRTTPLKKNSGGNSTMNPPAATVLAASDSDDDGELGQKQHGRRLFSDEGDFKDDDVAETLASAVEEDDDELDEDDHLGEIMVNIVRALGIDRDYKPRVIQSLHKSRTLSSTLRSLKELCGSHYVPAMAKLERMRMHFSRPNLALMLEAEELEILNPACSALIAGQVPLLNFNWQADQNFSATVAAGGRGGAGTSASETSEDDYDFKSFTAQSAHLSSEWFDQTMAYAHGVVMASRGMGQKGPASSSSSSQPASFNSSRGLPSNSALGKHLLVVNPQQNSPFVASVQHQRLEELLPLGSGAGIASKLWPQAEAENDLSANSAGLRDRSPSPVVLHRGSEAEAALMLRRFSFSKHALFSLLKGRPLVVHGCSQDAVALMCDAFKLVAVYCIGNEGCNSWLDRPLRMSDLSQLVLIGLSKAIKIPTNVSRYISVLDLDSSTLDAPPYTQGRLLDGICDPSRKWQNPETYLAFVYAELAESATLACLYYYSCCVGVPMDSSSAEDEKLIVEGRFVPNTVATTFRRSLSSQAPTVMEQDSSVFWKENKLSFCDAQVVQFFSELIKQQQCQEMYGSGSAMPMIKLDYSKCEHFSDQFGTLSFGGSGPMSSPQRTPSVKGSVPSTPLSSGSTKGGITPKSLFF